MRGDLPLSHIGAGRGDIAAKCSVGPWIGSETRKMLYLRVLFQSSFPVFRIFLWCSRVLEGDPIGGS